MGKPMRKIELFECEIIKQDGEIYAKTETEIKPIADVFRKYVGNWIGLTIMEDEDTLERCGISVKFKEIEVDGELQCECKGRKRKHHPWTVSTYSLDDDFKQFLGEYVTIRSNPNVKETGIR